MKFLNRRGMVGGVCMVGAGVVLLGAGLVVAADDDREFPPRGPVPYLSPEESHAKFEIPEGYRLELVLSEPTIREPVAAVFDGNGRMFVAEMRTYMQDIDGTNQKDPVSRVSMHTDTNGDGTYDRHTVFIDNLLLPRILLPLDDRLVVGETDTNDLYAYRDTDGDGVADEKELFYEGGPRGGNLEHQPSGLIWAMDNWLYTTYNPYRLRLTDDGVTQEPTGPNGGQWGLAQDNYGKPWFVNAGGERGPINFQQPIAYGAFSVEGEFREGYETVWPLVPIPDVQGGPPRARPDEQTLNHFTATCGPDVFRGDRLPEDLRGDLLFAEPVGRLIRRSTIKVDEGVTYLDNVYERDEFIRSTDPNFRPVNMMTSPDGTLYIIDMYRGIIQEGNWVREGSYLRKVVQQYNLDENYGRGRIWRLVHEDYEPGPQPRMLEESPSELVEHLAHPNGWWRDTAQKLLILAGDDFVGPTLTRMVRDHENPLARIHALWTLEGLGALDVELLREKFADGHPEVRRAAIRASESLFKEGNRSLAEEVRALATDPDPEVVVQVLLTANLLEWPDASELIRSAMRENPARGVQEIGSQILYSGASKAPESHSDEELELLHKGKETYRQLCFSCHGNDGRGMKVSGGGKDQFLAPSLVGSERVAGHPDLPVLVVLHGLLRQGDDAEEYLGQMVAMKDNSDEWVAAVVSYIRNKFGNSGSIVTPEDVAKLREATRDRTEPFTIQELNTRAPRRLSNQTEWTLSASHGAKKVKNASDGDRGTRYDTGVVQVPGMWFQIELPEEVAVAGLTLETVQSPRDYPRGYEVRVSPDGENWGEPVVAGEGNHPVTEIAFPPQKGRFIRITQTGRAERYYWSIHELKVFRAPAE